MENKAGLVFLAIAVVMAFGVAYTVTVQNKEEKMVTIPLDNSITAPDTFKTNFVEGCMDGVASKYTECSCAYDILKNDLGKDGLADMSINYLKTQQLPERLIKLVTPCFQ